MASMKKEEARRTVLSEYDKWTKKHPNKASMMGGFPAPSANRLIFQPIRKPAVNDLPLLVEKGPTFSIFVRLASCKYRKNTSMRCCAVISYALSGEEKKARAAGCDDYVPKPFSPRQLLAKIRQYLS
jgi:hypothetical protein